MDQLRQTGKIIDEERIRDRIILEKQTNLISKNDNLIFENNNVLDADEYDSRRVFYSLVDRTITEELRHLNLKLNKFRLKTTYDPRFEVHLNSFIRYALDCNVQDLDITLGDNIGNPVNQVVFDKSFFINPSFTHLRLACCFANPTGFVISWENLKSLCLSNFDLNDDLIQSILSGSPRLETFKLNYCHKFTRLDITSKSVKKLAIYGCIPKHGFIHLNAPNILSLTVEGCFPLRNLVLLDVFSLVKAKFYYSPFMCYKDDDEEEDMLKGHILKLCHIKHELKLKLGRRCSEIFSWLEAQGDIVPPNIKPVHYHELA